MWQTQVNAGIFNQDSTLPAHVGNEWCNFLLLLFFHTFKSFIQAHNSLEGWGNTAIPSRKEQSQSLSQHVDHWRFYILSSRIEARIWCLWWPSNHQHQGISEWKLFVTLWKIDTWHLVWQVTRHPCKSGNSVRSSECINNTSVIQRFWDRKRWVWTVTLQGHLACCTPPFTSGKRISNCLSTHTSEKTLKPKDQQA